MSSSRLDDIGTKVFSIQAITSAVNSLFAPIASKVAGSKLKQLEDKKKKLVDKISKSQQLQGLLNDYLTNRSSKASEALMRSSGFGNDMWIAEKEMDKADSTRIKANTIINSKLGEMYSGLDKINQKENYISSASDPFSAVVRSNKTKA